MQKITLRHDLIFLKIKALCFCKAAIRSRLPIDIWMIFLCGGTLPTKLKDSSPRVLSKKVPYQFRPPTKNAQDEAVKKCEKIASADNKAEESTVQEHKS